MPKGMIHERHRCAECKCALVGIRNGDLYCRICNTYADPDEPSEAHLIEDALFSDEPVAWASHRRHFVYEDGEADGPSN
jgi:hypothetical protein